MLFSFLFFAVAWHFSLPFSCKPLFLFTFTFPHPRAHCFPEAAACDGRLGSFSSMDPAFVLFNSGSHPRISSIGFDSRSNFSENGSKSGQLPFVKRLTDIPLKDTPCAPSDNTVNGQGIRIRTHFFSCDSRLNNSTSCDALPVDTSSKTL